MTAVVGEPCVPGVFGLLTGGGVDSRVYGRWGRRGEEQGGEGFVLCVCLLCGFGLELRKILLQNVK